MPSHPELLPQTESALGAGDHRLRSAVTWITATFAQKLAQGLPSRCPFLLPTRDKKVAADSEFELLTWFLILSP